MASCQHSHILDDSPKFHSVILHFSTLRKELFIYCFHVCVCVYALPPIGFFRLHDICDIREKFGSTIFCCEHFWVLLPGSFISISESILFHLQRRKLQPTAYWRENDMICLESVEKMIYIDIGNKSAHSKLRSYEKILKIRRLL